MLSDELWSKHREIMCQFTIYDKPGLRMAVEGALFRIRVGCPWRDLPEAFGKWNSVYKKFNPWSKNGLWLKLFQSLTSDPDTE
jgi:transposase